MGMIKRLVGIALLSLGATVYLYMGIAIQSPILFLFSIACAVGVVLLVQSAKKRSKQRKKNLSDDFIESIRQTQDIAEVLLTYQQFRNKPATLTNIDKDRLYGAIVNCYGAMLDGAVPAPQTRRWAIIDAFIDMASRFNGISDEIDALIDMMPEYAKKRIAVYEESGGQYYVPQHTMSPQKEYLLTDAEIFFLDALNSSGRYLTKLFTYERYADGAIGVRYDYAYVGRVKIRGRKYYMQILTDIKERPVQLEGDASPQTVHTFVGHLSDWYGYIRRISRLSQLDD